MAPGTDACRPAEPTLDRLLGGRLVLAQPARGFRTAIDAVLLAAAIAAPAGSAVLDAGCGVGAASLCLARRRSDLALLGLEFDRATAALASANVARNDLAARVTIIEGDLMAPPEPLSQRAFDVVMTNPPFNAPAGRRAGTPSRALAMVDESGPAVWLGACLKRLRPRGRLVLVHRADRLPEVLAALLPAAGDIEILPLWPKADGRPARRAILRCRKGAKGPARLRPGLVLHDQKGKFTPATEAILRDGAALDDVLLAG